MAVRASDGLSSGFRVARAYALNASKRAAGVDLTAYDGIEIPGPRGFDVNIPASRQINHDGGDRNLAVAILPSLEGVTATLRAAANRNDLITLLTTNKATSVGEASEMGWFTDRQGNEPTVGLMVSQQSIDMDDGSVGFHTYVFTSVRMIPKGHPMNDQAAEHSFEIAASQSKQKLWGAPPTFVTNGYTKAAYYEYYSEYLPHVACFVADGTETDFEFSADKQGVADTAKYAVFENGTLLTSGVTPSATKVTFSVAPTLGDEIHVWYELA